MTNKEALTRDTRTFAKSIVINMTCRNCPFQTPLCRRSGKTVMFNHCVDLIALWLDAEQEKEKPHMSLDDIIKFAWKQVKTREDANATYTKYANELDRLFNNHDLTPERYKALDGLNNALFWSFAEIDILK